MRFYQYVNPPERACSGYLPKIDLTDTVMLQVLVDGVDIRTVPLRWLREQVGLVSQVRGVPLRLQYVCMLEIET